MLTKPFIGIALTALFSAAAVAACSASTRERFDAEHDAGDPGPIGFTDGGATCTDLDCKRPSCGAGLTTTLTGKVFDPAGVNPLYNVLVYIPNAQAANQPLPPITKGAQCETCSSIAINPMTSALTNTKGVFTLRDVPVDKEVPVVVQIGKWRRLVKVEIADKCAENTVPDGDLRLPKNRKEGDLPTFAVTAGGCDSLQCLLKGIGIDDTEFVPGHGGNGAVHVFNGSGGSWPGAPAADTLWTDKNSLMAYDVALLSCECSEHNENKGDKLGIRDYVNAGGRVFGTHFHYTWFKNSPDTAWQGVANWGSAPSATSYDINTTFPKGKALAEWLVEVGASSVEGKVGLSGVTNALATVNAPTQSWIINATENPPPVRYFSFNAPLDKPENQQCGRAVYGDLHLMGSGSSAGTCSGSGSLNAQQKALEYMLFDLSSCVQSDSIPPGVPK